MKPRPSTTSPVVLGYYPSWKSGVEPSQIRFASFTHLCHAFVTADTSGTLKTEGNLPSRELTTRAHIHGVKVLLSLGGMDSGNYLGPISRDPETAERFLQQLARMTLDYGYDGVDLDWEFPRNEQEKAAFVWMARRLRQIFDKERPEALLTSALSGSAWAGRFIDEQALLPLLDFVSVMTYDIHGPWGDHAGHNAPFAWSGKDREACRACTVQGQMEFWTKNKSWPRHKLLVGLPAYGRGFCVKEWYAATSPSDKAPHAYLPYKEVARLLADGWVRSWDETARVAWLSKAGANELISYDDEQSVALKARWARQEGYRGIFFWEISQDYVDGRHVLVDSAREAFLGAPGAR